MRYIYQDSFDNVWLGTWGGGINFISSEPSLFTTIDYSPIPGNSSSLNNKIVSSICTDRQGRLWIGTDGGGINVFENNKRVAIYKKETGELLSNSVQTAFQDSKGNLWFGTFQGSVSLYNPQTKTFRSITPMGRANLDIRTFCEDNQHRIWIGCSEGIYIYDPDKMEVIQHYHSGNSELHGNLIRTIEQDDKGRFWIGTFGDGMGVYSPDFHLIKHYIQREGFCSNTINQIYEDKEKRIWVATGDGLVCFRSPEDTDYQTYQRKDGFANTFIQAITEDQQGNIWFSTNKGIGCYVTKKKRFYYYGHSDDVPAGNFMRASVAKNTDGSIYFGSINGLCCFAPNIAMSEFKIPL